MSEATLVTHAVAIPAPPKLLVDWSSPWREFVTAIRPALVRSPARLAAEARTGIFPYHGMLSAWILEGMLLTAAVNLPDKLPSAQPYAPLKLQYDILYYSPEELPRLEDVSGAQAGTSGRAGGREGHHRTQTIRVVRGDAVTEKVIDVPKINLPKTDFPKNLLAFNRVPGVPPSSGLRSSPSPLSQADAIIAPPPDLSGKAIQVVPSLRPGIVAPPPDPSRVQMRTAPAVSTPIIPPPPEASLKGMNPTPTFSSSIVPPAPTVTSDAAAVRVPTLEHVEIVPPPVSAPVRASSIPARLSLPQPAIVAPPPSNVTSEMASVVGKQVTDIRTQVVPPPPQLNSAVSGRHVSERTMGAMEAVPPPVQLGGASSIRKATGAGPRTPDVVAPPLQKAGTRGNSDRAVIVVSRHPGLHEGVPASGESGSMAMSPTGTANTGVGGSGGANSIGRGKGPGSGLENEGSGASKIGRGLGSDPAAHSGISPYAGPGGAGSARNASTPVPGVSVRGGNPNLPSFEPDASDPNVPGRSSLGSAPNDLDVTVEGGATAGGAFKFYHYFKGDKVYSIYITTTLGTAELEYTDPTSATHSYAEELIQPLPLRKNLPAGLRRSHLVITCILNRSGELRDVHVLEGANDAATSKIVSALHSWKFRPAQRGSEPVEVNAILGFNIDTR
jgi:hypothetical protein